MKPMGWGRWMVVGALALGLGGCGPFWGFRLGNSQAGQGVGQQTLRSTAEGNILSNQEARVQITLPDSWQEDRRLHPQAELQASDPVNNLHIVVLSESDPGLMRNSLQENAATYRRILTQNLAVVEGNTPTDVAFVGDRFAQQHEIRGQVAQGDRVVYLHTTVLSGDTYYQVVAWTTPEQYAFSKTELQTITESFRDTRDR